MSISRFAPERAAIVLSLLVATAFVSFAGARVARAENTRVIVIDGGEPNLATRVSAAARRALREHDWSAAVEKPISSALKAQLRSCFRGKPAEACDEVAKAVPDAEQVLAIELGATGSAAQREVTLTGWLVSEAGELALRDRRYCIPCTGNELEMVTGQLVAYMVREVTNSTAKTVIRIQSSPPGAVVRVNGRAVGISNLDYTVYHGAHQITLDKPGYVIEVREVVAPLGATVTLHVELEPDRALGRSPGRRTLAWVLGGSGVVAIAAGVTLMTLDSPAHTDRRQNREYHESLWPGMGVGAAGVGLVGAGLWLWLRRPEEARDRQAAQWGVSGDGDGVWVVGTGRF